MPENGSKSLKNGQKTIKNGKNHSKTASGPIRKECEKKEAFLTCDVGPFCERDGQPLIERPYSTEPYLLNLERWGQVSPLSGPIRKEIEQKVAKIAKNRATEHTAWIRIRDRIYRIDRIKTEGPTLFPSRKSC